MKPVITALATLFAAPALAHQGVHIHPHSADPVWLPLLLIGAAIAGTAMLIKARAK